MGRRKIEIKPILNDRNRSVTFVKRKNGLFKKAFELGVLCSVDVAVIIFEERAGGHVKLHEYCSADVDTMVQRHLTHDGERETKRPSDFRSHLDDDGLGPEDEDEDDDDESRPGGSGARKSGGGSAAGAAYGGTSFVRPGQSMGAGTRLPPGGDAGSLMGASSSSNRTGAMGTGYDVGYSRPVAISYANPPMPHHSHPSLQAPTHSFSHTPQYGTSPIPFSQERGAGSSSNYGYVPSSKRQRLDSVSGYPSHGGPSPYTMDNTYLPQQQHQSQGEHSAQQQDTLFSLGAAFGRPTPSPTSATGSHTGGARGSMFGHGSTSPHHGGSSAFVNLLGENTSPASAGASAQGPGQHTSFAWPSHNPTGTIEGGATSSSAHTIPQTQPQRTGIGSGAGGGGGGAGGSDVGWLDFLSSAPGHASGSGASAGQPGASSASTSSSVHHQHQQHAVHHSAAPTPLSEAPTRLGKRTRSDSADEGHRDDAGFTHQPGHHQAFKQEDTGEIVPGMNPSHAVRARVDIENDLEHIFGLGKSVEEHRPISASEVDRPYERTAMVSYTLTHPQL